MALTLFVCMGAIFLKKTDSSLIVGKMKMVFITGAGTLTRGRLHPGAWVEVEVDLPPGEYQLRVELGSALMDNNVNDAMTARVAARATRNLGQTADGELIRQQIASLLRRATSRVPSQRQVSALLSVLDKSAARAKLRRPGFVTKATTVRFGGFGRMSILKVTNIGSAMEMQRA